MKVRKSYILTKLTIAVAILGVVTSLLALWYAYLSTYYTITLHNPRLRIYNSFEVGNESISLRGYGFGLEVSELLSNDVVMDINQRVGFRIDYVFNYLFRDTSCSVLNLHNLSIERIPLIPYELTNIYEVIHPLEVGISIKDFSELISKSCANDISGWLYVNVLLRYSYLIVDPKYPGVKAITLQRTSPYNIIHLKIPVSKDGTTLRFTYDNVTYFILDPFTGECKICNIEKRCTGEICTYTFLLTEVESFTVIKEVNFKPRTALENERTLMLMFTPTVILLIITSLLLIYYYLISRK